MLHVVIALILSILSVVACRQVAGIVLTSRPRPGIAGKVAEVEWLQPPPVSFLTIRSDVAVVGNGPLTQEDRAGIARSGFIVRCNGRGNMRAGERTDLLCTRQVGSRDWGRLHEMTAGDVGCLILIYSQFGAEKLLEDIQSMNPHAYLGAVTSTPQDNAFVFGQRTVNFAEAFDGPSTGWMAVYIAMQLFRDVPVHVFGIQSASDGLSCADCGFATGEAQMRACNTYMRNDMSVWRAVEVHNSAREIEELRTAERHKVYFH
jgi:hypothetical protein